VSGGRGLRLQPGEVTRRIQVPIAESDLERLRAAAAAAGESVAAYVRRAALERAGATE
jgi:uncharacterized protein (DUF1778 family)